MVKERESSADLAEEIYRLVCQSRRGLLATVARALEARGEPVATWQIVSWVARHGPTTQRDLARELAQHPAGISRQVDDLEKQGLVRRQAVADRRRLLVEATSRGRQWFRTASADVMAAVDRALTGLSFGERRELRNLMRAMVEATGLAPNLKPYPTRSNGAEEPAHQARA